MDPLFFGEKLYETDHLFVVRHPKPSYPIHYLILPKDPVTSIYALKQDSEFWNEVPEAVQVLVNSQISGEDGYRIITNGGAYQEIPLLHIHFVSGEANV